MTLDSPDESAEAPLLILGSEPLVPILRLEDGKVDPVALATWHQALSNTVAVEVPHDLMGLWLYPTQGGVVLLGPIELAEDDLAIPIPVPHLKPEQLSLLEATVVSAGYGSASCLPIRFGKRDVALILVADLQSGRYGPAERVLLQCVAQRVAPMLGRIARQWTPVDTRGSIQQERIAGLLAAVAQANCDAGTPQRFVAGVARGLAPLLPHDHVELLVPDANGERYLRLGEHAGGPLWADPSLAISREHLDIAGIFGGSSRLLVPDTYEDQRWPRGFLTATDTTGADIRAVIGARLNLGGASSAYLLVGSVGPELYGVEDVELLSLLAGLIAPQIGGFVRPSDAPRVNRPPVRDPSAELLFRIAGRLATTSDAAAATRAIAVEGSALLPYDKLTIALRLAEGDSVVLVEPGEERALPDLPQVPVEETPVGRVLRGESPHSVEQDGEETRLIVPLRVAGEVHGALLFSATDPASLGEAHVPRAQRLADIVAAHLELLRRAALTTPTPLPDWKPVEKPSLRGSRALPATPPLRVESA
ncbi:MAG TPA: GAF domain-containing protein [Gemmatimonadales bacterium]|nr:GAF domain-containing protein [Gemmatimonadales bacterium]